MTTTPVNATVRMKLTISRDEHPAMFDALISIRNPRRRSGRLKELVIKALTLEQLGATTVLGGPVQVVGCVPADAAGTATEKAGPSGTSVTSGTSYSTAI